MKIKNCSKCYEPKPYTSDYFYRDKSKASGLHHVCKKCANKSAAIRQKRSKRHRVWIAKYNREIMRPKLRAFVADIKTSGCSLCNYNKCNDALDFHHVDPKEKEKQIAGFKSISSMKREMTKCVIVCSNCHREIHSGLVPLSAYENKKITFNQGVPEGFPPGGH